MGVLRVGCCEDEGASLRRLKEFLLRYGQERGLTIRPRFFWNAEQLLETGTEGFDLLFLDIEMGGMDGMSAAERIRQTNDQVVIVFITNMTSYAIRGYAVDALDYVVKPITYAAFAQTMDRAIARVPKRQEKMLTLQTVSGLRRVRASQIHYIESQRHTMVFHLEGETISCAGKMADLEQELEGEPYFRINRGYLVNLSFVRGIQHNCVVVDGELLPVARSRSEAFMRELMKSIGT